LDRGCRNAENPQVEPERATTDGHTSYPKAIAEELGNEVDYRTSQYKNNVIEQDHESIANCGSRDLVESISGG
jgi:transposase-like protein